MWVMPCTSCCSVMSEIAQAAARNKLKVLQGREQRTLNHNGICWKWISFGKVSGWSIFFLAHPAAFSGLSQWFSNVLFMEPCHIAYSVIELSTPIPWADTEPGDPAQLWWHIAFIAPNFFADPLMTYHRTPGYCRMQFENHCPPPEYDYAGFSKQRPLSALTSFRKLYSTVYLM